LSLIGIEVFPTVWSIDRQSDDALRVPALFMVKPRARRDQPRNSGRAAVRDPVNDRVDLACSDITTRVSLSDR
jgi:hypothetical protein